MTLSPATSASLSPGGSRLDSGGALTPAETFAAAGANTATSAAVTLTGGAANTKGAWAELSAATPFAAQGFVLSLVLISATDYLFDIGIGAAGSEVVIVSNIQASMINAADGSVSLSLDIPFPIAAGVRVAMRVQGIGAAASANVAMTLYDAGPTGASAVTTYGANTADSGGTTIDPGAVAQTKGAWVQLTASTTAAIDSAILLIGSQANATRGNYWWLFDIGIGSAGNEVVVVPNLALRSGVAQEIVRPQVIHIPLGIAAGVRVAARAQSDLTDASDRLFDLSMLAFTA